MAELTIVQFPCRSDNFGVIIHDSETRMTAAIDAPEAEPIRQVLKERGWKLTHILTTHYHPDHIEGNEALKAETGCVIIGPEKEAGGVPGIDRTVKEGSTFDLGGHNVTVFETPGHTLGHVTYWLPDDNVTFVGDTLFSLGCGRLLEGDGEMMWKSVQKIMALPKETLIYCGHEYSESNARFALSVEPNNASLQQRAKEIQALRADGQATLPVTLAAELAQNPFLRPDSPEIQERLGMVGHPLATIFSEIRRLKDRF
ncbi:MULTISPECIES: hydroxyacylglutathione hydrolase [Rhodomicrobium]|uniref:hydroxyacylglutathione hydrolase n=1 Tax=Rhodomicrobium TaxID=1068 RepID=UPI000B4B1075|nr:MULTISPECIES: hydroxyacylglutathione hydrolase [Rhodomicrobium]